MTTEERKSPEKDMTEIMTVEKIEVIDKTEVETEDPDKIEVETEDLEKISLVSILKREKIIPEVKENLSTGPN